MTDAAAVVVSVIARSREVAPPLSWLIAQFPPEAREGLVDTLNQLQGDVLAIWMNRDDGASAGPRITLSPAGAERFGWRLDDDSRSWVAGHAPAGRIKIRPRKRMISLTDFARGRAGGASDVDGALECLSSIADPRAVDPAEIVETMVDGGERRTERDRGRGHPGRRSLDAEPRPPAIILMGCRPWPPTVFEGAGWKCQVCRDRPLAASMECAWCDRGGQDALIPRSIRAKVRQSRVTEPGRAPKRLRGGKGC